VVDKKSGQVEKAREPGDHEDDVESFYPEHRVGTASEICVHTGHEGGDRLTQHIAYE
jgi:hypothetical protein